MSRRLILLRHAKSSWDDANVGDHQRRLNARGQRDAPRVAQEILRRGWQPELVLCSDARRTRETWQRMQEAFQPAPPVTYLPEFYHGTHRDIVQSLCSVDDAVTTVMAIGHNPGWQDAVRRFSSELVEMTTGNAALLEHSDPHWASAACELASWRLVDVIRPKALAPGDEPWDETD